MRPRSINIFLAEGDPGGIRVAQVSMSTIQALAFRKLQLSQVRERFQELSRPGVYILLGYRHQSQQMRQRAAEANISPEHLQEREQRRQEHEQKKADAIANAERDEPIRLRFHAWMERSGFRSMSIPEPGQSYSGSHVETLWEAYLDATLVERAEKL